jgi:hypothetical protein
LSTFDHFAFILKSPSQGRIEKRAERRKRKPERGKFTKMNGRRNRERRMFRAKSGTNNVLIVLMRIIVMIMHMAKANIGGNFLLPCYLAHG